MSYYRLIALFFAAIVLLGLPFKQVAASRLADATPARPPVDVILVLDTSASMVQGPPETLGFGNPPDPHNCNVTNQCEPLAKAKAAAQQFVGQMYSGYDRVGVVSFDHTAMLIQPLTTDLNAVDDAINGLQAYEGAHSLLTDGTSPTKCIYYRDDKNAYDDLNGDGAYEAGIDEDMSYPNTYRADYPYWDYNNPTLDDKPPSPPLFAGDATAKYLNDWAQGPCRLFDVPGGTFQGLDCPMYFGIDPDPSNCGTTDLSDAIREAGDELTANGSDTSVRALVLLSDGRANAAYWPTGSLEGTPGTPICPHADWPNARCRDTNAKARHCLSAADYTAIGDSMGYTHCMNTQYPADSSGNLLGTSTENVSLYDADDAARDAFDLVGGNNTIIFTIGLGYSIPYPAVKDGVEPGETLLNYGATVGNGTYIPAQNSADLASIFLWIANDITTESTPTESPILTGTIGPISTKTSTIIPTAMPTKTPTSTETLTPTALPTVIVDDFDTSQLSPDWAWYVPAAGPTYSLLADPGSLQLVVPPGFDHWGTIDRSPQLRRTDMGSGNWSIETHIALDPANAGVSWHSVLMVAFDSSDHLWLGSDNFGDLRITRAGQGDIASTPASFPLTLRINRRGTLYTFEYRPDGGNWASLGSSYTVDSPVDYVGLLERTFYNASGNTIFDVDYFRLERYGPAAPTRTPTPSPTITETRTPTVFYTRTPTITMTPTKTMTFTVTPAVTITPTVTPIYSIQTFGSSAAQDGWVLESNEGSSQGGTLNSTATTLRVGDNAQDRQFRSILSFDTAGLPDNAVIASATLKLKKYRVVGTSPFTTHAMLLLDIRKPYFGTFAALQASDFEAGADLYAAGIVGSAPNSAGYYTSALNNAALADVNKAGQTQLRLRFELDDNDDLAADYLSFYSGDTTSASYRPVLVIKYYVPTPASTPTATVTSTQTLTSIPTITMTPTVTLTPSLTSTRTKTPTPTPRCYDC